MPSAAGSKREADDHSVHSRRRRRALPLPAAAAGSAPNTFCTPTVHACPLKSVSCGSRGKLMARAALLGCWPVPGGQEERKSCRIRKEVKGGNLRAAGVAGRGRQGKAGQGRASQVLNECVTEQREHE